MEKADLKSLSKLLTYTGSIATGCLGGYCFNMWMIGSGYLIISVIKNSLWASIVIFLTPILVA